MKRTWGCLLIAAVLVSGVWHAPAATETRLAAPQRASAWRGTGSCSASACHGSLEKKADDLRCAYSTWMAKDIHPHAFDVLLTERSRIIERNFRKGTEAKAPRPEQDRLCLKCHSMDADAVLHGDQVASSDGIGCERCHGAAEHWLSRHYSRDWQTLSAQEKEALGFRPTKDLKVRAKLCVECHVGTGEAQVDHDLYGGGHPRIQFELASFVATMPPHWNVRAEKARHPDLEARLWTIGQMTSAQAAMELLAYHADAKKSPTWPEFAEHSCYACHQGFEANVRKRDLTIGVPWNDWNVALLRTAKGRPAPLAGPEIGDMLAKLRVEMDRPLPDRERVAAEAQAAARALAERVNEFDRSPTLTASSVQRQFEELWKDRGSFDDNLDSATQCYLGLAALHNALTDLDPARRDSARLAELKAMQKTLRSPSVFNRRP